MTLTAPATPWLATVPLVADGQTCALLIVHEGRAIAPQPALRQVVEFEENGQGGFISAAQAVDGRWGYIDAQGQWLIAPTLDNARGFSDDGLARFCRDGLWGYIDLLAREVIPARFADAKPMRNGLAAVKPGPEGWRIIDRLGRFTCGASFHALDNFGAVGLALAQPHEDRHPPSHQRLYGYVDHHGQWVMAPRFAQARAFDDHAAAAVSLDAQTWGLIDAEGAWLLKPCYPCIETFNSEGLAYYDEPDSCTHGHGYLNTRGKVVIKGGRHLSRHMACGLVADSVDGTRIVDAHGKPLQSPALAYASEFRSETGCAVARLASHPATDPTRSPWGLLHASGRWVPAPVGVLEPLTDSEGWIPRPLPDTPLVPFLTTDGQMAWIDTDGNVVWRARYDGHRVVLRDTHGHTLWTSEPLPQCEAPRPFFKRPATDHLDQLPALDEITCYATNLANQTEQRLHRIAQGFAGVDASDTLLPAHADHAADAQDNAPLTADAHYAVVSRRLARACLSEAHHGPYAFLGDGLARAIAQLQQALHERLHTRWGPADPDPEHVATGTHSGMPVAAWNLPLQRPLVPTDTDSKVCIPEANTLWISLSAQAGTGDGDAWWELWLTAAPSVDALQAALCATHLAHPTEPTVRQRPVAAGQADHGDAPATGHATHQPTTREAWLQAVQQDPSAVAEAPPGWLDSTLVDAALAASPRALSTLPPSWHTPERLQALVCQGLAQAREIPPHCMTRDALLLARERYAGDPDWDWHDEQCSQVPSLEPHRWDRHSLQELWGCLLTPEAALHAVRCGTRLRDVPHWLRTEALEHAALQADIDNLCDIAPERITAALAERAVLHNHGRLIARIPQALLTPALCLASVQTNGLTLQDIPPPLRSTEVCTAALQERSDVFHHVPRPQAVAVTTRLIERDLARARQQGDLRPGSPWHVYRAWAHLWNGQPEQALVDAQLGLPLAPQPQHAHYVLASAHRTLGQTREAAREASTVLAMQCPHHTAYTAQWDGQEDTRWLAALARQHMQLADEATLVQQLQTHPHTLADVPRARITPAMVDAAVQADEGAVRFVPKRWMTPAHYAAALRQGVKTWAQVPPHMLSEEACADHVRGAGWRLADVPKALRTVAVCALAMQDHAQALHHVPARLQPSVLQAAQAMAIQQRNDEAGQRAMAQPLTEQLAAQWRAMKRTPAVPWMLRARRQGGWVALLAGSLVRTSSPGAAQRGPSGFVQQRPVLALLLHLLGGAAALIGHAMVSVAAWRDEGGWAGLLSFALPGVSELFWAMRFAWDEPGKHLLAVTAALVAAYVLVWCPLYCRAAKALAASPPEWA